MQAENRQEVYQTAPRVNAEKCKFCGKCIDYCKHKVVSMQKGSGKILIEPELCTDCGKCYKGCSKKGAIKKHDYLVGLVEWTDRGENVRVFRVAFRKKWLLKKKGLPVLKKHIKGFEVKIYSFDANYCGKSIEKDMDFMFDIKGKEDGDTVLISVLNLMVD
ncbi:MAG: 4Fe-4S binding protein [Bacteroidales bacterium]|nr:4Fe-4S binding protein [Bacteroidales bacterium]